MHDGDEVMDEKGTRKTVLVVDDDGLNLKLFRAMLTRASYTVLTCQTGEEGVATARRELPALVLMDVKLPTIDGLEATRRIKADEATAHIPVVAVTAWAGDEDRRKALAAGCADFVAKPVDLKTLIEVVRRLAG